MSQFKYRYGFPRQIARLGVLFAVLSAAGGCSAVNRLSQIVNAGRRADEPLAPLGDADQSNATSDIKFDPKLETRSNARAVAAAAEAFAERLRSKVHGLAA